MKIVSAQIFRTIQLCHGWSTFHLVLQALGNKWVQNVSFSTNLINSCSSSLDLNRALLKCSKHGSIIKLMHTRKFLSSYIKSSMPKWKMSNLKVINRIFLEGFWSYVVKWTWSLCLWRSSNYASPRSAILAHKSVDSRTLLAVRSWWVISGLWILKYRRPYDTSRTTDIFWQRNLAGTVYLKSLPGPCVSILLYQRQGHFRSFHNALPQSGQR